MKIGPYSADPPLVLAPMAGVTDRPFRQLCRRLGAGLAVSEMIGSNPQLRDTAKSRLRSNHEGEPAPIIVQIAGAEPDMMAEAARYNVAQGAQIIDINMGCPAKKVCNKLAGSALLADEALVARILEATVKAVEVPVTLKFRTGPEPARRNAVRIARIAEDLGIAALALHGRTRADAYRGQAEYDTIAEVKSRVTIPVMANGDIDSPEQARAVLDYTGADALMIGRAAQGRPWIFREIAHYLAYDRHLAPPSLDEVRAIMLEHIRELHAFYGDYLGVRVARKHIGWYLTNKPGGSEARRELVRLDDPVAQIARIESFFDTLAAVAA